MNDERNKRLYPIDEQAFNEHILPVIEAHTRGMGLGGRPPKISHYVCFCAMLTMMRVSQPWRDLDPIYGPWHTIYTRFKRWSERGLFWNILYALKQAKHIEMDIVFMDSTTVKLHRHGSGAAKKKGPRTSAKT